MFVSVSSTTNTVLFDNSTICFTSAD